MHQQGGIKEPVQTSNCMIASGWLDIDLKLFCVLWKMFGQLMRIQDPME